MNNGNLLNAGLIILILVVFTSTQTKQLTKTQFFNKIK